MSMTEVLNPIATVAMPIHTELGVRDPVPGFDALPASDQSEQRFWRGAQKGGLLEACPSSPGVQRSAPAWCAGHAHIPGLAA